MSRLGALQVRLLEVLTDLDPPWILFGGGALLAAYADDRTTRDLDLLWAGREALLGIPDAIVAKLRAAALAVEVLHTSPAFVRLRVDNGDEVIASDLVATPTVASDDLRRVAVGSARIQVPRRQGLLADKLCALLSRLEVRDLLRGGADLEDGLHRAVDIDGGFSPMTLAWVLRRLPLG